MPSRRTYPEQFRAAALESLAATDYNVEATARAFGISDATLRGWIKKAGITLPDSAARAKAASDRGRATRWGDYPTRRKEAKKLRIRGQSLGAIARALGYRSDSAVHYAVESLVPKATTKTTQKKGGSK